MELKPAGSRSTGPLLSLRGASDTQPNAVYVYLKRRKIRQGRLFWGVDGKWSNLWGQQSQKPQTWERMRFWQKLSMLRCKIGATTCMTLSQFRLVNRKYLQIQPWSQIFQKNKGFPFWLIPFWREFANISVRDNVRGLIFGMQYRLDMSYHKNHVQRKTWAWPCATGAQKTIRFPLYYFYKGWGYRFEMWSAA